ncbi:hypothetical protein CHARACLAT_012229 [Characodon lateralis]|uniref:Uncharacterized protein n=1 Tax=Characodon lateralis TaxID=208331 RepID=A0ABU7EDA1_9TELE|nr:hypothetical protein [Characodon lateralis]
MDSSSPSGLFTVDHDALKPASSPCLLFLFVGLMRTFRTETGSSLGHKSDLLPDYCDDWTFPVFILVEPNVTPSGIWRLKPQTARLLDLYTTVFFRIRQTTLGAALKYMSPR